MDLVYSARTAALPGERGASPEAQARLAVTTPVTRRAVKPMPAK
jgi:hypothetical protein